MPGRWLTVLLMVFLVMATTRHETAGQFDANGPDGDENRASRLWEVGKYQESLALMEKAVEGFKKKLGANDIRVGTARTGLAVMYMQVGKYGKAEVELEASLKIFEKDPMGKFLSGTVLEDLARIYAATGRPEKAAKHFERALKHLEKTAEWIGGEEGSDTALLFKWRTIPILSGIGNAYRRLGNYAKAKDALNDALKVAKTMKQENNASVYQAETDLAMLLAQEGESDKAGRLFDRVRRGKRRFDYSVMSYQRPSTPFLHLYTADGELSGLWGALSLGMSHPNDKELAALSASWLLNGKAMIHESYTTNLSLTRQSSDPEVGKLSVELRKLRATLAQRSITRAGAGRDDKTDQMIRDEATLSGRLRRLGGSGAAPAWYDLAELCKSLPKDGVFIDIARLDFHNYKAKGNKTQSRYAAWVTPSKGDVKVIDLGPADKIDEAVTAFRKSIAKDSKGIKNEVEAEKAVRVQLDALSKLVLNPLLPHIGTSKRWLLSPDGNLWLLPFEALTLDGKYAIEKYHISYFTSGRDVIPAVAPKVKVSAPVILANPDFDLDPKQARAAAKKLRLKESATDLRSAPGSSRLAKAKALQGTAKEAREIEPLLKTYTSIAPDVYTQEKALEGVFKSLRNPRVLVLATHGFFLPEPKGSGKEGEGWPDWENPLIRSGLLLAGCNNAAKVVEGDDGILTALEVVGTDLRGCELVVLSACETGVGDVQTGEGVAGLRQAFQLAGAKAVVSTLWQVPDKESARLMSYFFGNLSKGKMSKADALREAKRKLIDELGKDKNAAHPFYWAAFTLTGE